MKASHRPPKPAPPKNCRSTSRADSSAKLGRQATGPTLPASRPAHPEVIMHSVRNRGRRLLKQDSDQARRFGNLPHTRDPRRNGEQCQPRPEPE